MPEHAPHSVHRLADLRSVFAIRAYRLFVIGNAGSLIAIWLVRVCIAWMTWELTHSKSWLGIITFAELAPSVLITLWSGPLADRLDRIRILRWGQGTQTLITLGLLVLTASGALTVWWMLAAMVAYGIIAGVNLPARLSAAPSLVPRNHLATASAVSSLSFNFTRLTVPFVGAALLAANLNVAAFALAAIGFLINNLCLSAIDKESRIQASAPPQEEGGGSNLRSYREAIIGAFADQSIALALTVQFLINIFVRSVMEMFPAFADQVYGHGEHGFAALMAAVGLGAIAGAGLMVGGKADRALLRQVYLGGTVLALAALIFSMVDSFSLALVVLFVFGALLSSVGVSGQAIVQLSTPIDRLGRVMSFYSLISRFAPAVGALVLGFAADAIGVAWAAAGFAVLALVTQLLLWPIYTKLMRASAAAR